MDIRRQLLTRNPYFQEDLIRVRSTLGLPESGFIGAIDQLETHFPTGAYNLRVGKPELSRLLPLAQELGLPLEERIKELREIYALRGLDFDQALERSGWGVLPIFSPLGWAQWWTVRERLAAGGEQSNFQNLGLEAGLDLRMPSVRAARLLVERYQLGRDFTDSMAGLVLGCPPGGGESDVVMTEREDGAGMTITINCVPLDATKGQWEELFDQAIQPSLLAKAGKIPAGVPWGEGLKEARRLNKPGRPPYSPGILASHLGMWEFWFGMGPTKGSPGEEAFQAFLSSLADNEDGYSETEILDVSTFRKAVLGIDQLMRPEGSEPHFFP